MWHRGAAFLVAAAVSGTFFINFCNLVYRCGCRSLWNGIAETCNIHTAGVPHCPWCSYGLLGLTPLVAIVAAQALVGFGFGRLRFGPRLILLLALFPVVGGVGALLFGWLSGYWS